MSKYQDDINKARPFEKDCINYLREHKGFSGFSHIDDLSIDWTEALGDAYDPINKEWMEIKVDYYKPTGNLFIERFSNLEMRIDGGPWQYKDCKFYAYYFKNQGRILVMETKELLNLVEELAKKKLCRDSIIPIEKTGKRYRTMGYLVKETDVVKLKSLKQVEIR